MKRKFESLLDHDRILKETRGQEKLKITLKKDPIKGRGIFATRFIQKGEVIALYKMKIFNYKKYKSPTNYVYSFTIYDLNGDEIPDLIGDITMDSIPLQIDESRLSFWGLFVNEPLPNQKYNADFDCATDDKRRKTVGKEVIYSIYATKDIEPGDEVTVYYGKSYPRSYSIKPPNKR